MKETENTTPVNPEGLDPFDGLVNHRCGLCGKKIPDGFRYCEGCNEIMVFPNNLFPVDPVAEAKKKRAEKYAPMWGILLWLAIFVLITIFNTLTS